MRPREIFTLLFPFLRHRHDWDEFSFGKRRCRKCGEEQWLFENKYPAIGEPQYEWKSLYEPRFL